VAERDAVRRPLSLPDDGELAAALAEANLATLLMTYVHLTHDESLLNAFEPHLGLAQLQRPEDVPTDLADDLRDRLRAVLTGRVDASGGEPSDELYRRMMSVAVGEEVTDEFLPLLYDQIGFKPQAARGEQAGRAAPDDDFQVVVIGAGLAGIATAVKLQEAGYRFVVLERNADIGGTWYLNTYPGVGVDTPSHFYSYSFDIWPHWSHYKPKGSEMFEYFSAVVDRCGLRRHIRFDTTVEGAIWDEAAHTWQVRVRTPDGEHETIAASALVNAQGFVHRAVTPDIPGLDDFEGPVAHTAQWPRDVDLRGKRVAVFGTGASGVQLVPAVCEETEHVAIFMRSKHWVLNNAETDVAVSPGNLFAIRYIPHYREWFRFRVYWIAGDGHYLDVLKDPAWEGNPLAISAKNEMMRQYALKQMQDELADYPDLLERVTPDFPIFSKRIISHPKWWETLKRDDVELVSERVERVLAHGVRTVDGTERPFDVLVLATGFDIARMHGDLDIRGRDGHELRDDWGDDDPRGYMGVLVPGYPNYFHLAGPNSAPNFAGGANLIAEAQVNYVLECLDLLQATGHRELEVRDDAAARWNERVDAQLEHLIWSHPGSRSYYHNRDRRNYLSWPFRLVDYWHATRHPELADLQLRG
jgi:4-hydroxyacetophenone monooxygenase